MLNVTSNHFSSHFLWARSQMDMWNKSHACGEHSIGRARLLQSNRSRLADVAEHKRSRQHEDTENNEAQMCKTVQTDEVTADQIVSNSTIMPLKCFRVTHISWVKPRGLTQAASLSIFSWLIIPTSIHIYYPACSRVGGASSAPGGGDQSRDLDRRSGGHRVGRLPSLAAYLICF